MQLYFGSCRTNYNATHAFYAAGHLKSCTCIRQIIRFALAEDGSRNLKHLLPSIFKASYRMCYERKDATNEDNHLSDIPYITDSNYRWFSLDDLKLNISDEIKPDASDDESIGTHGQVPLSECPGRCSDRGTCFNGRCKCMVGFYGLSCELSYPNIPRVASGISKAFLFEGHAQEFGCINHCGFRGVCENGFCHCESGFWGIDCTRSKAYEAGFKQNERLSSKKTNSGLPLKIYRYELPWTIAPFQHNDDWRWNPNPTLYSAFIHFFNVFSNDSTHRVENPYEADLFYVPMMSIVTHSDVQGYVKRALSYVRTTYPHLWARKDGRDHFFWLSGDLGSCWLRDEPIVQNPIKITHFGLDVTTAEYTKMPNYHWVVANLHKEPNRTHHCHKAERDIVAPNWMGFGPWALTGSREDDKAGHVEAAMSEVVYKEFVTPSVNATRRYLLFFGGAINLEQFEYSGGARQAFFRYVVNNSIPHPDVVYQKKGVAIHLYRASTFCFCPYGGGWGNRLVHAMASGCIPVIVQEFVHQPFEGDLDYSLFSIKMRVADVPQMVERLRQVSLEEIQRYRQEMYKVYKAFSWVQTFDGQAYDYTLRSLRRRLDNL